MLRRAPPIAIALLAALAACNSEPVTPSDENALAPSFVTSAAGNTIVVTEADITRQLEDTPPTDNWVLYYRPTGSASFRTGPGDPPLGTGSFEMITPDPAAKFSLFNFDYLNKPVADFTALGYHTYQSSAAVPVQLPSLNLTIDLTGGPFAAGDFATLVFEPVYNVAQGPIVPGTWQDWDAIFGGQALWWLTRDDATLGPRGTIFTWNAFQVAHPAATILGGIGPNQGSGGAALTASVDAFLVGVSGNNTTYDFELFVAASSKDDCKDGGWRTVKRANGTSFKNQGDCVSYTNNGK